MKILNKNLVFLLVFLSVFFLMPLKNTRAFFSPSKNEVGLNVHWTLGASGLEDQYRYRLRESNTKWAREHFSTEVILGDTGWIWLERYDSIMKEYEELNINVVGLLAYGPDNGVFTPPNPDVWEEYVRTVVARYNEYVDVWEIWNEPDSPDYLEPSSPDYYVPMLETAYDTIKLIDPKATVLIGGLANPDTNFMEGIASKTNKYDAINFHAYYCGYYRDNGDNRKLLEDLSNFKRIVNKYTPNKKAWITELGCSTGMSGIGENFQKNYLQNTIPQILNTGFIERIFLYNIRNYDYLDKYENNFGLLDVNMNPRPAWNWYKDIPKTLSGDILKIVTAAGPGGGPHIRAFDLNGTPQYNPNKLFPYSENFRGGINIAMGDVDADGQDEIIIAPKKGGGPHVRIFETNGTPRGIEFWPFNPNSNAGVNIAAGDVDGDGKDEIAFVPEQGEKATVKVYRYNSEKSLIGEWDAFGEVKSGASIAMGDIDYDSKDEIIVGAGPNGSPQIRVFEANGTPKPIQFFAFDQSYKGGINVAAGDINNDGRDEIGVCQASGESWCRIYFYNNSHTLYSEWKAYGDAPLGATIDMGDIDRDGKAEILTGASKNGGPHVRAFEANGSPYDLLSFFAYDKKFRGGVDIALGSF
jgi:hypothetical protein